MCLFGYTCDVPANLKKEPEPVYNFYDYVFELRYKLQKIHSLARKNLVKAKVRSKSCYDIKNKQYRV